ncbi:MAG: GIY-YIG nuclease family protein [Planctomycetota bacterium]
MSSLTCVTGHQPLPFCVYVLLSEKDGNFYVGMTEDLPRRLDEHFNGRSAATAPRRPLTLIHCEFYITRSDTERREQYLKSAKGRRTLKLMLQDYFAQASVATGFTT